MGREQRLYSRYVFTGAPLFDANALGSETIPFRLQIFMLRRCREPYGSARLFGIAVLVQKEPG